MKKIEAIIRPFKLEDVKEALKDMGIEGITITEVSGYGRQLGHTELYRGAEYDVNFTPKLRMEIVVNDESAEEVKKTIEASAKTGKMGDGKVFISEITKVIRIRTGEEDSEAI